LIEKGALPGGLSGSFEWRGHLLDHGPHRLSPSLEVVRQIAEELLGPDLITRRTRQGVQIDGKCYQFPPRTKDWISPKSVALLTSFLGSFAVARPRWVVQRFQPDTFETVAIRKFGRSFYEKITHPMANKVWIDPKEIDPLFVEQRFSVARPTEVIKKVLFPKQELNPSTWYYPRKGFQQLWTEAGNFLVRQGTDLRLESEPIRIDVEGARIVRVVVRGPGGETTIEHPNLQVATTIPLHSLIRIIRGFDTAELLERCKRIKIRSLILALLEYDRPEVMPFREVLFPQSDFVFNRLFDQNEYSTDTIRGNVSVLVGDITIARNGGPAWHDSDEEVLRRVEEQVSRLPYLKGALVARGIKRVEFAYPVPDTESRRQLHYVNHSLKSITNLHVLGRFGVGEYDNSDYALDNGITLGAMLAGRISKLDFILKIRGKRNRVIV
jgi:protoporphyrinogen oxidase